MEEVLQNFANDDQRKNQVDIVIPIYGHPVLLKKCVETVFYTTENAQLILVDDCSPGEEIKAFFSFYENDPRIVTLRTSVNTGFIGSTNLGAGYGKAPWILFLNSDIEAIEQGWLEKMIPSEEDVAVVGALLLYPPSFPYPLGGTIQHAGVARKNAGIPYHPFVGRSVESIFEKIPCYLNAVTGGCFLIRRKIWEEMGGWEKSFGRGVYEDVDLCWRIRDRGYKIKLQKLVKLFHHQGASRNVDQTHSLYEHMDQNQKCLQQKWGNLKSDEEIFFGVETTLRWEKARKEIASILNSNYSLEDKISQMNRLVEANIDLPEALKTFVDLLIQAKNHREAAIFLEKLIQLVPDLWILYFKMFDELITIGDFDKASKILDFLHKVFPEYQEIQISQKKLAGFQIKTQPKHFPPDVTLKVLLESDDLLTALNKYESCFDIDLYEFVKASANTARGKNENDFGEGLDILAEYIYNVINKNKNHA